MPTPYLPPEIVTNIFEQCRSRTTLKCMALMCWTWYDIYLSVSWRTVDDIRTVLVALCRGKNFRYEPTEEDWNHFLETYSPRIRYITIQPSRSLTIVDYDKLLRILLTYVEGVSIGCVVPNLRSLTFENIHKGTARKEIPPTLLSIGLFFQSPSITTFHFYEGAEGLTRHRIPVTLLVQYIHSALDAMPRLKEVCFRLPPVDPASESCNSFSPIFTSLPSTVTKISLSPFLAKDVLHRDIRHLKDTVQYLSLVDDRALESRPQDLLLDQFPSLQDLGLICDLPKAIEFVTSADGLGSGARLRSLLLTVELHSVYVSAEVDDLKSDLTRIFQRITAAFSYLHVLDIRLIRRTPTHVPSVPLAPPKSFSLTIDHLHHVSRLSHLQSFALSFSNVDCTVSIDNKELEYLASGWSSCMQIFSITRSPRSEEPRPDTRSSGEPVKGLDFRGLHVLARYFPRLRILRMDGLQWNGVEGLIFGDSTTHPGYSVPKFRNLNLRKSVLQAGGFSAELVFSKGVIEELGLDGYDDESDPYTA